MEEKNSTVFMDSESDISTERVKTEGIRQYPRRKKNMVWKIPDCPDAAFCGGSVTVLC